MESKYDPGTGICWQFRNKGDRDLRHECPACSAPYPECGHTMFGRCRSGRRWFWTTYNLRIGKEAFGYEDTEKLAMAAAMAAVCNFHTTSFMTAVLVYGHANRKLKELDEAKRRQRPAPDTSDTHAVEYLYGYLQHLQASRNRPESNEPNICRLKAEMAAAHPDRGGSNAAFIEARKRYVAARKALRPQRAI